MQEIQYNSLKKLASIQMTFFIICRNFTDTYKRHSLSRSQHASIRTNFIYLYIFKRVHAIWIALQSVTTQAFPKNHMSKQLPSNVESP